MKKPQILFTTVLAVELGLAAAAGAATQYWDNDGNAVGNNISGTNLGGAGPWDTSSVKWWDGTSGTDAAWVNGNDAQIKGTGGTITVSSTNITAGAITMGATNSFTITPSGGKTLSFTSLTVSPTSGVQTTLSGGIAGTDLNLIDNNGAINNNVAIGGTNTFTGNVNLNGTGAGTTSASRLALLINTIGAIPGGATINLGRNEAQLDFNVAGNHGNVPNNFVLNTNPTPITNYEGWIGTLSGATVNLTGQISGNGSLVFGLGANGGAGIMTLSNTNTYTGATRLVNAATGVIRLGVNDALPTSTALSFGSGATASGSLDLNGKNQTIGSLASAATSAQNGLTNTGALSTLTIKGNATTTYTGRLGVAANITNLAGSNNNIALVLDALNTGQLTITGDANAGVTYSGGTTINGGTLVVANTSNSGTGTGPITIGSGGTLKIGDGGANGSVNNINMTNNGNVVFNRNDSTTYTGTISSTVSGAGNVTQTGGTAGAGTLILTGPNSYNGNTTINGGILQLGASGVIPDGSAVSLANAATAMLNVNGQTETIGSLAGGGSTGGNVLLGGGSLAAGGNGSSTSYGGAISGAGTLTKQGAGTMTLTGNNNTYTGNTIVSGGTLLANNSSGSATGASNVSVGNGATLGGTGSISGTVAVNAGGTLAPGASPESLATGTVTFSSSNSAASNFKFDIAGIGPTAADLLYINGDLNIASTAAGALGTTLTLNNAGAPFYFIPNGTKYTLISYTGSWNTNTFAGVPDGGLVNLPGIKSFRINYHDDASGLGDNFKTEALANTTGAFVTLTAVPELGSFITMGLVGFCAIGAVRLGKRFGLKAFCV